MSGKVRVVLKERNQNAKPHAKVYWPKLTGQKAEGGDCRGDGRWEYP